MTVRIKQPRRARRGAAIIYILFIMPVLIAFVSLAVDYAHVQTVRVELRRAAIAAARYGAVGLAQSGSIATQYAIAAAADNASDGQSIALTSADVELGEWDSAARTFTVTGGTGPTNAVRVTARRTAARNTAVPLLFAQFLGQRAMDVQTACVAVYHPATTTNVTISATNDPYLAGEPDGTNASTDDWAGPNAPNGVDCRPAPITSINFAPGSTLSLTFTGGVRNNPSLQTYGPDGNLGWILSHEAGAQNGVANVTAPINAVMGMFLDDNQPDQTAAPAALDFSTQAARDYTSISPQLKQPFFIGDGKNSAGTVQKIVVPTGATRFYLCTMDGYEWSNDSGSFTSSVNNAAYVSIVK
jgi:Flp pilus assembly protein TadG